MRDMRHTKWVGASAIRVGYAHMVLIYSGHVADITSAQWHPKESDQFITASNDSTIR